MLYLPPTHTYLDASLLHPEGQLNSSNWVASSSSALDGPPRSELSVGQARYPFRSPLREHYSTNTYWVEGFWPLMVGRGDSIEEAKEDFECQVHSRFQELASKPDFDRTEQEDRVWSVLSMLIDLSRYDQQRFVTSTEMGQVERESPPRARIVRWASGRREAIDLSRAHPKFAAIALGRWFEAVVRRKYLSSEFIRLEHLAPVTDPWFSEQQRQEFWRPLSS
jgi:hypothetical protein